MSTKNAQPKNANARNFVPKAGPSSKGYSRKSKKNTASGLMAGRDKPLFEQIRSDKVADRAARTSEFTAHAASVRETLSSKLSKYPDVMVAIEFTLERFITTANFSSGHATYALKALEAEFADKLTQPQMFLAKRAFRQEIALYL